MPVARSAVRWSGLSFVLSILACGGSKTPANPNPAPTPTPAPAPTPTPTPITGCEAIGPGAGPTNTQCRTASPSFLEDVDGAINRLVAQRPELFDLNDIRGDGGYKVLTPDAYFNGVVRILNDSPTLCAIVDGGGEIGVKSDNSLSDQYHILLSSNHIRRGEASYRATCYPAWF